MQMIDDNPFLLAVENGETITVKIIQSFGMAELVNYSLNGSGMPFPKSTSLEFTVTKNGDGTLGFAFRLGGFQPTGPNPSRLVMLLHFAGNNGGSFKVKVTGSQGGVSGYSDDQRESEAFRTLMYTFSIPA